MLRLTSGCYIIDGFEDDVNNNNINNYYNSINELLIYRFWYIVEYSIKYLYQKILHSKIKGEKFVCKKNVKFLNLMY